jgi:Cu/Zn superoxide dismutase
MRHKIRATIAGVAAAGLLGAGAVAFTMESAGAHERWAQASLRSADGTRLGSVSFADDRDSDDTAVTIWLRNTVAVEAFHGIHIHANDTAAERQRLHRGPDSRRRRGSSPPTATGRRMPPRCTLTTPVTCRACS